MKLVVFGGSGQTGLPLLEQALQKAHEVTAIVRDPSKLPNDILANEKLNVAKADIFKADVLEKHVKDADVVISTLGFPLTPEV